MKTLTLEGIYQIKDELESKITSNFITNVVVVNSSDILLTFSFYSEEKLIISLAHQSPLIGLVDKSFSPHTVLGNYNDNLRKYLKGCYINKIEVLNNDRVLKFTLHKSDEFFNKQTYYLILELIPTISNLIFLNKESEIIFAKHYSDLSASRPVIRKFKYIEIAKNNELERKPFDLESYKKELEQYVASSLNLKKKESALPLYNFFKQKEKSLKRKIKVLEEECLEAQSKLVYQEYGTTILTYKDEEELLNNFIYEIKDIYNNDLSPQENANNLFNKYKKYKRTIENDTREIELANNLLEEFKHYLAIFPYLEEEEILSLSNKYLPHKQNKKSKALDANSPYYVIVDNVKIGFGKNANQNNELTFKIASKEDAFLHINKMHGPHVVIFNKDISKNVLTTALEIAVILAGQKDGEIQVAKIKDIKKGSYKGEALLNKYETYVIKNIRESTYLLLNTQKRF